MARFHEDLLDAARQLVRRRSGQRGKLPSARIRRSISTSYYALFHFLLGEVGLLTLGTHNDLRKRRRILARAVTHRGLKTALDKLQGAHAHVSIAEFLRAPGEDGEVAVPRFVRDLAKAFVDAQSKRHDADYDLNEPLSALDARLLRLRVRRVIRQWDAATGTANRETKRAVAMLILMNGKLRHDQ